MKYGYFAALLLIATQALAEETTRIGSVEYDKSDRYLMESKAVGDTF